MNDAFRSGRLLASRQRIPGLADDRSWAGRLPSRRGLTKRRRTIALAFVLIIAACASAPTAQDRCFVAEEAMARRIAALVSGMSADDGSLHVSDEGDHWRVGRYAETWLEGEMIMSRDAGFTFVIDKCTGAMSGYRAWG